MNRPMSGRANRARRCSWRRCATSRWRCRPPAARCTTPVWTRRAIRGSLAAQLQADIERLRPARLVMTAPGDWRVLQAIKAVAEANGLPLDIHEDRHFYCSVREFAAHAKGRKSLRMEYFYREQRQRHRVLMDGDAPIGGQWNFDADNREAFGAAGPGAVPRRMRFEPDAVTREVIALVNTRFAEHPGRLDSFAWPVTRAQALQALQRLHRGAPAAVRPLPGRDVAGRPVALPRAPVGRAQPEAAEPARGGGRGRSGLPRRARAAGQRRRLHPPDPRLARVRARHLLDPDARIPGTQRARCPGGPARVVLDRRHRHGLPARRARADADARLRQPHPAPDGHRPVRADAGRAAQAGARLVPGGLRRCGGVGRAAQHPGHEPVRRRRRDGQQALHRHRQVHPAHEPALQGLPLRPRAAQRRQRLPVHHPVLGLPDAP